MLRTTPPEHLVSVLREPGEEDFPRLVPRELKRSIYKQVLNMGIPSMMGFLLLALYSVIDIFWLAKIGAAPVAAVTVFSALFAFLDTINGIIGSGSVAVISQSYGANDKIRTERAIKETFFLKFFLGSLAGAGFYFFLEPLYRFLGAGEEVIPLAIDYGVVQCITLGLACTSFSVYTAMRCIGKSKGSLKMQFIGAAINMALDPLLIFGIGPFPEWGIFGASVATSISYMFVVFSGMWVLARESSPVKIHWFSAPWPQSKNMWNQIMVGLPAGLNHLSHSLGNSLVIMFISVYGTVFVALYGMSNRIIDFSLNGVAGLSLGTAALIGQFLGSKERYKAWISAVFSTRLAFWLMGGFSLLLILFAPWVVKGFFTEPDLVAKGRGILQIMAIALPFMALNIGSSCAFSGAGQNVPPMILSFIYSWALLIPLMYVVGPWLDLGAYPMLWVFSVSNIFCGIASLWLLRRGSWLTHQM